MKEKKVDFIKETDVLGQSKVDQGKDLNKTSSEKIDYSEEFEFPTLKTRYFTVLIDTICILLISVGIAYIIDNIGEVKDYVKGILFVIAVLLYEPILVSVACTPGQLLNGIRIRRFKSPVRRINFFSALFRISCKALLGWLSFLTISMNKNRRAIHDFASGSIVLKLKEK